MSAIDAMHRELTRKQARIEQLERELRSRDRIIESQRAFIAELTRERDERMKKAG